MLYIRNRTVEPKKVNCISLLRYYMKLLVIKEGQVIVKISGLSYPPSIYIIEGLGGFCDM